MVDFAQTVNAPQAASMTPPKVDSSWISNLYDNFIQGQTDIQKKQLNQQSITQGDQQTQLNAQRIQQGQQQAQLARAFPNGLPIDQSTGQVDYRAVASTLAKFGDVGSAVGIAQQQPPPQSTMLPAGGPAQQGPQGQPASIPAKPLPPPAANSPQGDAGQGTITSLVTDKLPSQNQTTGQTIMKIAETMGVDPNANLTPGQQRRAQGLLKQYAGDTAGVRSGGGGNLPPSAAAASPAPPPAPPQGAPNGAGSAAPQAPAPVAPPVQAAPPAAGPAPQPPQQQQQQQPQQPQGNPPGPIGPQVPLPNDPRTGKPFTDPQQAILALRAEAARYAQMPNGKPQAQALDNYASRIEESTKPLAVNSMTTLVDPRTGKPVFQGPAAASLANAGTSPTLDADAERYRQTGQLPPNMGRGMQGSLEAKQIRARAAEKEIEEGGDPSQWPDKWQTFKAKGVGLNTAERTKAAREENLNLILKAADAAIPAALEASKALPRGSYVPLNRLIQKGEIMSSDPRLVEFGMANLQLAEHWARAMNPTGVMRESDRDKALTFLDTAYGNNTYERAVMQLQKQITRERDAVRGGGSILKDGKAPAPGADSAADKASKPNAEGWTTVTLPSGSKARVQEVE